VSLSRQFSFLFLCIHSFIPSSFVVFFSLFFFSPIILILFVSVAFPPPIQVNLCIPNYKMPAMKSLAALLFVGAAAAVPTMSIESRSYYNGTNSTQTPADSPFLPIPPVLDPTALLADFLKPSWSIEDIYELIEGMIDDDGDDGFFGIGGDDDDGDDGDDGFFGIGRRGNIKSKILGKVSSDVFDDLLDMARKGPEPDLDKKTLEDSLSNVAKHITKKKGGDVPIVATGGSLNVLHLGTRPTTHDIDYFNADLDDKMRKHLSGGFLKAREKNSILPSDWINANPTLFYNEKPGLLKKLTDAATEQNEVIWHKPGLKVYAGAWNNEMLQKLNKWGGSQGKGKPYDLADASHYLKRYMDKNGMDTIDESKIQEWSKDFQTEVKPSAIKDMDDEFKKIFGRGAVNFGK
jgi:hypothetical protein